MTDNPPAGLEYLRGLMRQFRENIPKLVEKQLIDRQVETDMVRLVSLTNFPPAESADTGYELRSSVLETDALGYLATRILVLDDSIRISQAEFDEYQEIEHRNTPIFKTRPEMERAFKSILLADYLYMFFTLCANLLESLSIELIEDRFIADEHRGVEATFKYLKELNQIQRNELLYRSGAIDAGLKGEMDRIRKIRNKLSHQVREKFLQDSIENLDQEIRRGVRAVNRLHEHYSGVKPLGWVEEES